MGDINKYLESQLALAEQRKKKTNEKVLMKNKCVSGKSKNVANRIAKKQDNLLKNNTQEGSNNFDTSLNQSSDSAINEFNSDEDYVPFSDEEMSCDEDCTTISTPSVPRIKRNFKKIIDDGDTALYNERVENWRSTLAAASSRTFSDSYYSADIQYVLEDKGDPEEIHELQNGLRIPKYIWIQLYKYQRTGVKWLWELHQLQSGGMLGDEMGLGKTVQVVAFLAGLFKTDCGSWGGLGPTIIVAPATVIYQWVSHFHHWCPPLRVAVLHHSGSHSGNHNKLIRDISAAHGILLVSYAGIVKYSKDLLPKNWHYIILDEGHKIRNPDTQVSKLVKQFKTAHKLLITGSPMQNSLQELWSLFDFMRPGLLGTYPAFMDNFAIPITQGGYANATELQEQTALEIAKALKNMITPYMLRRSKAEVQEHIKLPEKNEQVLFCALTKEQRDLYKGYLTSGIVRSILDKDNKYAGPFRARVLVALTTLRKICNHPDLYLYEANEEDEDINCNNFPNFGHWKRSGKMSVVHSLLKLWNEQGHRTLIFSQSRVMICILEQHLQNYQFKYLKMDGTVTVSQRQNLIKTFNESQEYLVFLSTTRVGGLGVNLTGADRVIIYDPDWNPATDNQAKERAWRIGQRRNVTVYRLISAGTIEEKIYQRQIFKNFLGNKILVDPNQKNVLTTSTLQGLFNLEELNCDGDTETASLFKHTKVNINSEEKNDKKDLGGGESSAKKKLEAMRKRAREISRNISKSIAINRAKQPEEDPREKYKKKRAMTLKPPEPSIEPEINLLDDKITNVPFENVLSELDIINKHSKKDYEQNLLREVLNSQEQENEVVEVNEVDNESTIESDTNKKDSTSNSMVNLVTNENSQIHINIEVEEKNKTKGIDDLTINDVTSINKTEEIEVEPFSIMKDNDLVIKDNKTTNIDNLDTNKFDQINKKEKVEVKPFTPDERIKVEYPNYQILSDKELQVEVKENVGKVGSRKRKHSTSSGPEIKNLLAIKKIKSKKHTKDAEKQLNDDDYVLSKLFAKATVKNALQHDIVIGLAEKERKYKIKEEAMKNAKKAIRAVKFSTK